MNLSLRTISQSLAAYRGTLPRALSSMAPHNPRIISVWQKQVSFLSLQQRGYSSWSNKLVERLSQLKALAYENIDIENTKRKILETLTGMKQMNAEETEAANIAHQKLWVAHASIGNDEQAHAHYEFFYSIQLFQHPKNFDTQQYYLSLVEKNEELLSVKELQEIVELYQFAIGQGDRLFPIYAFTAKLEKYQALLDKQEKIS